MHGLMTSPSPLCAMPCPQACPAACLVRNGRGQTPVDVAVACERGEVLNAMLLACAGDAGEVSARPSQSQFSLIEHD